MKIIVKNTLKIAGIVLAAAVFATNFWAPLQYLYRIPEKVLIWDQQGRIFDLQLPFFIHVSTQNCEVISDNSDLSGSDADETGNKRIMISASENEGAQIRLELFGIIPIKSIDIRVMSEKMLVPGGQSIGVKLHTHGALIVGLSDIFDGHGTARNPAKDAGLAPGDVVEKINGTDILDAAHLQQIINDRPGERSDLVILREGSRFMVSVLPVKDPQDGKYRLGAWVRDSTAGVGTLTFYDPRTKSFGALGHAVTDVDTKSKLIIKDGEIVRSKIIDVKQGDRGEPGELHGTFVDDSNPLGRISYNTVFGIFGTAYDEITNDLFSGPIAVASQYEAVEGPAKILTTIDDTGVHAYDCIITHISAQSTPQPKGMVIRITDKDLLAKTGGIVQGMSGSPILQGGKLLGAVTHVFINDPTRGYGIFVEWMLEQASQIKNL
jgi:stage IV sporulation protein B